MHKNIASLAVSLLPFAQSQPVRRVNNDACPRMGGYIIIAGARRKLNVYQPTKAATVVYAITGI
jgi:hypothetical protein